MLSDTQILQDYSDCIEDVMKYIREHISEPLDRETLAAVAGFSVPHFHRVFTAQVGESAISYIRRLRLERAARKLRMGAVDITEVALAAGYDTHAAFMGVQTAVWSQSQRVPPTGLQQSNSTSKKRISL
jgi:AraC family transcriptional regulator